LGVLILDFIDFGVRPPPPQKEQNLEKVSYGIALFCCKTQHLTKNRHIWLTNLWFVAGGAHCTQMFEKKLAGIF
jgi:hypothetical protein